MTRLDASTEVGADHPRPSLDVPRLVMTLALTSLGAAMFWQASAFPPRVALVPRLVTAILVLLGAADLTRILRRASVGGEDRLDGLDNSDSQGGAAQAPAMSAVAAIAWFLGLVVGILLVGFVIAVPVYMVLFLRLHGRYSWRTVLLSAASMWLLIDVLLVRFLHLPVYAGWLLR